MIWTDLNELIIPRTSSALLLGGKTSAAVSSYIRGTAKLFFVPWTDQMMFHESTNRHHLGRVTFQLL
jgi:hypothetical protein